MEAVNPRINKMHHPSIELYNSLDAHDKCAYYARVGTTGDMAEDIYQSLGGGNWPFFKWLRYVGYGYDPSDRPSNKPLSITSMIHEKIVDNLLKDA